MIEARLCLRHNLWRKWTSSIARFWPSSIMIPLYYLLLLLNLLLRI